MLAPALRRPRAACAAFIALGLLLTGGRAAASPIAFTATLTIELFVDGSGDEPDPLAAGSIVFGGAGIADSSGVAFTLPAAAIGGSFASGPGFGSGYPIVTQQGSLANLAGSFVPSGSDVVGTMGMSGTWQWGLFGPPPAFLADLPIGPLGVGGSEASQNGQYVMYGGAWTTGTASVTAWGVGTLFATGSDARGPGGVGVIELVSPIRIDQTVSPSFAEPAGFATLTLTFVPEPSTAMLFGAALAAIAVRSRR